MPPEYEAGAPALVSSRTASRPRATLVAGAVIVAAVLVLNVPGNPMLELRNHQTAGMALAHAGLVLLAIGLWPMVSGALAAAAALEPGRLWARLAVLVAGLAAVMTLVAAAWPDYARQLLTREWGVVEPAQFVLYLLATRLCFMLADRWPPRAAPRRLYLVGGWLARLFAVEEIDYVGLLSALVQAAGFEHSRIGRSYVGTLHDAFNLAVQYGVVWVPALVVLAAVGAAAWWISGGRAAAAREMLSWRLAPAALGGLFMAIAQFTDIKGHGFEGAQSPLMNTLLEEPCELVAIACLNATLVLELAHRTRYGSASRA